MYCISAVKQMIITPSRLNERHKYFHIKSGFAATFVAVVAVVLTFHFASKRLWTWISYFSEPNPIIKHDIVYFKESFIVFFCLAEMNHNDLKPLSLWIWITEVDLGLYSKIKKLKRQGALELSLLTDVSQL